MFLDEILRKIGRSVNNLRPDMCKVKYIGCSSSHDRAYDKDVTGLFSIVRNSTGMPPQYKEIEFLRRSK